MVDMLIKDALNEYKQYLIVEKGLSKNTIYAYFRDLVEFSNYIIETHQITKIEDIDKEHIRLFLKKLAKKIVLIQFHEKSLLLECLIFF